MGKEIFRLTKVGKSEETKPTSRLTRDTDMVGVFAKLMARVVREQLTPDDLLQVEIKGAQLIVIASFDSALVQAVSLEK